MASITEYEPVAAISWSLGASSGYLDESGEEHISVWGPHWQVGYCDISRFPRDLVTHISDIPFIVDLPDRYATRLDGATLDYVEGQFVIEKRAT
jgi:hypothetical protein